MGGENGMWKTGEECFWETRKEEADQEDQS
jgi:hypothetical protein